MLGSSDSESCSNNVRHDGMTPSQREIRLLDVLPGQRSDPIECETRIVDLDGNIEPFEALSYVWGTADEESYIRVSKRSVHITSNLLQALGRLRNSTSKRTLWVDQLCINQWDMQEKATQVAMMRDIYRACSHCILWMGEIPQDDFGIIDAKAVFDFIEFVASCKVELSSSTGVPGYGDGEQLPVLFHQNKRGRSARKAFAAFAMYGNPWWSRVWTIQEAILPHSAHFVWGHLSVPRDKVIQTVRNLRGNELKAFAKSFQAYRKVYTPLLRCVFYPVNGFNISQSGEEPLDLLMRWRHRLSTDPRDKVYALLGLLQANCLPTAQPCSYSINVVDLFAGVTVDLIRYEEGLRALLGAGGVSPTTLELPSWVIDFTYLDVIGRRQLKWWTHSHRYWAFSACGQSKPGIKVSKDKRRLALNGIHFDEIVAVNEVYRVREDEVIKEHRLWNNMLSAQKLVQLHEYSGTTVRLYPAGGSWHSAMWRTMIGDLVMAEYPVERANDHHESRFNGIWSRLKQGKPVKESNVLFESLCGILPNHAFFVTKEGYLGIGPPHTQPGDWVWIFHGGQVPFIMRKHHKMVADDGVHWLSLVGDCYLHGIMDGEALIGGHDVQTAWVC
ncbi:hypothetical protein ACN47E_006705 [Coniothyrium glycines]